MVFTPPSRVLGRALRWRTVAETEDCLLQARQSWGILWHAAHYRVITRGFVGLARKCLSTAPLLRQALRVRGFVRRCETWRLTQPPLLPAHGAGMKLAQTRTLADMQAREWPYCLSLERVVRLRPLACISRPDA